MTSLAEAGLPSSSHRYHPSASKIIEEEEGCSSGNSDHLFHFKLASGRCAAGSGVMHNGRRAGPLHRQNTDAAVTDSTMFSVTSSSVVAPSRAGGGRSGDRADNSAANNGSRDNKKKKRFGGRFKLGGLGNILKRASGSNKKRLPSESQLRKRVRKSAERGDWDAVRRTIADYEFSDIPEAMPKRGSFQPAEAAAAAVQEGSTASASRRPSYGSRTGERRSFTGKESAAAAAVIKAAMLDESSGPDEAMAGGGSSSEHRPDIGENILHDVCRFRPPLDVLETLLTALRHRRGSTFGTDDQGRTPLHVAAACGASPQIIDALVRTDPTPASIGDADRRSPLHLAMKHLVNDRLNPLPQHHRGGRHQSQEKIPTPEEAIEQSLRIVILLKEAMLAYPGRIDFKDEDKTGYTPLDYVVDEDIDNKTLIQALIRRKEPRRRRSLVSGISTFNRRLSCARSIHSHQSSVTEDQDIDILVQLEQDEIDARRKRVHKMKAEKKKERINGALFDVFGIEEQPKPFPVKQQPLKTAESDKPPESEAEGENEKAAEHRPSEEDIYNQHMAAYLEDYMDDFEDGFDLKEHEDEDGFDIFADPELEEAKKPPSLVIDGIMPPVTEIVFEPDEDSFSVVSEVTVPVTF